MLQPKKLPPGIVAILEARLLDEYDAFYFYRSAANWCKNVGHQYAHKFFMEESNQELEHAKKIENYLTDWNVMPPFKNIAAADKDFKSLTDVVERAYEIEYDLYESYEKDAAKVLKDDICTFKLIQDLLLIQQESVAEYSDMINELMLINPSDKFQLYYIEKRLFKNG